MKITFAILHLQNTFELIFYEHLTCEIYHKYVTDDESDSAFN